jgi:Helix-turn-helix domain/DnaA N-terminal domain
MSIKIMTAVWELTLPDSEKLALLALADCANDEGWCWPSMATLSRKCSKSDRTLQKAIASLVEKGHLSRDERPGKGVLYRIHPRSDCTPENSSPPKPTTNTPEAASDNPKRNINSPLPPSGETNTADPGDQYWRVPAGRSWKEATGMLRELNRKPKHNSRRQRQASSGGQAVTPIGRCLASAPQRPVTDKARENEQSAAIHAKLKLNLGENTYNEWFANVALIYDDPGITVIVGSNFHQSRIEDQFQPKILAAARAILGANVRWVRVQAERLGRAI